jgi:diguanylate cyclase (GGDEF)-like protein
MAKEDRILKVLVCDDDSEDRKIIRHYLSLISDREIVIVEADNTDKIRKALRKGRIDLVFMDIQIPGKSGIQWLQEIVEKQLAPVVMLTGHGNEEIAVESLEIGAVGYLRKASISAEKISKAIDDALNKWEKHLLIKGDIDELHELISKDPLTGLLNRRAIMKTLGDSIRQARRYRELFSVVMIDIDNFKHVNDDYGHLIGDDVLETIGLILQRGLRETDHAGRYGGEEFIIVLSRADLNIALTLASRIHQAIMKTNIKDSEGGDIKVTASLGLTIYIAGDNKRSIIERADKALRMAKLAGRNRIRIDQAVTSQLS